MTTKTVKKLSKKNFSPFFVHNYRIGGGTNRPAPDEKRPVCPHETGQPSDEKQSHGKTYTEGRMLKHPETSDPHSLQNAG